MRSDRDFSRQLEGYRLATAEILYHLPDHPSLLQTYLWQDYDIAPRYPVLNKFLDFWTRELDGALHSVRLAGKQIISAAEIGTAAQFRLQ
ncbi:MAG: usg protein [Parvularculaceae bacterium]